MRLRSLDVFRGATIAAMVVVNNPGSWGNGHVYAPLRHAAWHGCTATDLIFPFFVFIVGVSAAFARERVDVGRIATRSLTLFGLGLLLNAFPFGVLGPPFELGTLRIPGVLQRLAVCYFATALLARRASARQQWLVAAGLLVGYWLLLRFVPAPGGDAYDLSERSSLVSWLDRVLLGPDHLWVRGVRDPEGVLSTLPAVAQCLLGLRVGAWLQRGSPSPGRAAALLAWGLAAGALGLVWAEELPLNKALWTSSFVLWTTGWALVCLALCHLLFDVRRADRLALPFEVFGRNAILLFVGSGLGRPAPRPHARRRREHQGVALPEPLRALGGRAERLARLRARHPRPVVAGPVAAPPPSDPPARLTRLAPGFPGARTAFAATAPSGLHARFTAAQRPSCSKIASPSRRL